MGVLVCYPDSCILPALNFSLEKARHKDPLQECLYSVQTRVRLWGVLKAHTGVLNENLSAMANAMAKIRATLKLSENHFIYTRHQRNVR